MTGAALTVIPAIDLLGGEAVRLVKGDYGQKTVYSSKPWELARAFADMGASWLHVVDLDGAKAGKPMNSSVIAKIIASTPLHVEVGGGIRDLDSVSAYLDGLGVSRVILGTAAVSDPAFLDAALEAYGPKKIVVGVDVRDGFVSVAGWLKDSAVEYPDFIASLEARGVEYIVVTDISKDGTLSGPNFELYESISRKSSLNLVVSGGVHTDEDVREAARRGYYGCIVGKAYYEGAVNLRAMMEQVAARKVF